MLAIIIRCPNTVTVSRSFQFQNSEYMNQAAGLNISAAELSLVQVDTDQS